MIRSTTILCVRKDGRVAMAGDGQVSMNNTVVKHHARKVRKCKTHLEEPADGAGAFQVGRIYSGGPSQIYLKFSN